MPVPASTDLYVRDQVACDDALARADRSWLAKAACVGVATSVFYPRYADGDLTEALLICRQCPVRLPCLEHAVSTREVHGVWGGTTPEARRRLIAFTEAGAGHWDELSREALWNAC